MEICDTISSFSQSPLTILRLCDHLLVPIKVAMLTKHVQRTQLLNAQPRAVAFVLFYGKEEELLAEAWTSIRHHYVAQCVCSIWWLILRMRFSHLAIKIY